MTGPRWPRLDRCSIEGCERPYRARGFCVAHYNAANREARKTQSPPVDVPKKCKTCEVEKPASQFERNLGVRDGRLNQCRSCIEKSRAEYRRQNIDAIREKDRLRGRKPEAIARRLRYQQTDAGKAAFRRASIQAEKTRPQRRKAYRAVRWALKTGKLSRGSCERCGADRAEAHHHDYSRPLDVNWLCHKCHMKEHHGEWAAEISASSLRARSGFDARIPDGPKA